MHTLPDIPLEPVPPLTGVTVNELQGDEAESEWDLASLDYPLTPQLTPLTVETR